jgi:DNA-directed RNA polymerase subunit RPC12/RpoP
VPIVLTCACGKRLRVSDDRVGQKVRCPACGFVILATSRAPVATDAPKAAARTATAVDAGRMCSICLSAVAAGETLVACDQCELPFHEECWNENGGCATYGCARAPRTVKAAGGAAPATSAWGDVKKCPACGREIRSIAVKCRFCGASFGGVDPITPEEYRAQRASRAAVARAQAIALSLFVASLLGCTAPATLAASLAWVLMNRKMLRSMAGGHFVIAIASIAISAAYCLLFVVFVLFKV